LFYQDEDLTPEQIAVLQKAFNSFDHQKTGSIPTEMVADILRLMGESWNIGFLCKGLLILLGLQVSPSTRRSWRN